LAAKGKKTDIQKNETVIQILSDTGSWNHSSFPLRTGSSFITRLGEKSCDKTQRLSFRGKLQPINGGNSQCRGIPTNR
jgi:hypothetical protein